MLNCRFSLFSDNLVVNLSSAFDKGVTFTSKKRETGNNVLDTDEVFLGIAKRWVKEILF